MPFRRFDHKADTVIEAKTSEGLWLHGTTVKTEFVLETIDPFLAFIKEHQQPSDPEDLWQILMDLLPEHRGHIEQLSLIRAKAVLVGEPQPESLPPFDDDDEDGD